MWRETNFKLSPGRDQQETEIIKLEEKQSRQVVYSYFFTVSYSYPTQVTDSLWSGRKILHTRNGVFEIDLIEYQ